jgi:hypothetical protein
MLWNCKLREEQKGESEHYRAPTLKVTEEDGVMLAAVALQTL